MSAHSIPKSGEYVVIGNSQIVPTGPLSLALTMSSGMKCERSPALSTGRTSRFAGMPDSIQRQLNIAFAYPRVRLSFASSPRWSAPLSGAAAEAQKIGVRSRAVFRRMRRNVFSNGGCVLHGQETAPRVTQYRDGIEAEVLP